MRPASKLRPSAFTVVELMIVAVVVAILSISAWPNRDVDDQSRLDAAMTRLESDVEFARSFALTSPANPSVMKVDLNGDSYWIAQSSAPDAPVTNPATRKPYVVQLGRAGDPSVRDVNIYADNFGPNHTLTFDSRGGVIADGNVGMEFRAGTRKGSLRIAAGSGATKQTDGDLASLGLTNIVTDLMNGGGGAGGGL